jgi:hypothetical protein
MHSAVNRVQNVFGYFTTVATVVAVVVALSAFIAPQAPSASLKLRNVQVYVYKSSLDKWCANNDSEQKDGHTTTAVSARNMRMCDSIWTQVR